MVDSFVEKQNLDKCDDEEDSGSIHFESLCQMVDELKDQLPVNDANYLRRDYCNRCERPSPVCLCCHLPSDKIKIKKNLKIWIFQHPKEQKRVLRTTRILEICLEEQNFEILKATRFNVERFPQLKSVYNNPDTYVLYPSDTAIDLKEFTGLMKISSKSAFEFEQNISDHDKYSNIENEKFFNVILIDGTWAQASGIYYTNSDLQRLKQIKIENIDFTSAYTIRTQPRECFLSTLETCAIILSTIEENDNLYNILVEPLRALCNYQFEYGAKPHQSKEYLIFNGLYKKPMSKKMFNKLTKNSKFLEENKQDLKVNYEIALNDLVVHKANIINKNENNNSTF